METSQEDAFPQKVKGITLKQLGLIPIDISLPSGIAAQVNYLSVGVEREMATLLDAGTNSSDFAYQVLHAVLLTPSVSMEQFRSWSIQDVEQLAIGFAESQRGLDQQLDANTPILDAFQQSCRDHLAETVARFQEITNKLSANLAASMQPLLTVSESMRKSFASLMISPLTTSIFKTSDIVFPSAAATIAANASGMADLATMPAFSYMREMASGVHIKMSSIATGFAALGQVSELSRSAAGTLLQAQGTIESSLASMAALGSGLNYSTLFPYLPKLDVVFERLISIQEGAVALDEAGFGYSYSLWTMDFIVELAQLGPNDRAGRVTAEIVAYTQSEELESELKALFTNSPSLRHRWPIVREGLADHKNSRFIVSIPTLFPQLEGVCSDLLILKRVAYALGHKLFILKADGSQGGELKGIDNKFAQARKNADLDDELASFVASYLAPSRNPILHGADVNYSQAEQSAHLILVLLSLASAVTTLEGELAAGVQA